jgi:hypothetical protein
MITTHHCNTYTNFRYPVASGSIKSADPILHGEPPLLKNRSNVTGDFKNLKSVGVP